MIDRCTARLDEIIPSDPHPYRVEILETVAGVTLGLSFSASPEALGYASEVGLPLQPASVAYSETTAAIRAWLLAEARRQLDRVRLELLAGIGPASWAAFEQWDDERRLSRDAPARCPPAENSK